MKKWTKEWTEGPAGRVLGTCNSAAKRTIPTSLRSARFVPNQTQDVPVLALPVLAAMMSDVVTGTPSSATCTSVAPPVVPLAVGWNRDFAALAGPSTAPLVVASHSCESWSASRSWVTTLTQQR